MLKTNRILSISMKNGSLICLKKLIQKVLGRSACNLFKLLKKKFAKEQFVEEKYLEKNESSKKIKAVIKVLVIIFLLFDFWLVISDSYSFAIEPANEENAIIDQQVKSQESKEIEKQLTNHADNGINELVPEYNPENFITDTAKGKFSLNLGNIINKILRYLFKEIYSNIGLLIKLVVLVILCSILKNLQASFLSESVGELAFFICYIVIVSVLIVSLNTALSLGSDIIDNMVDFMQATIPVLITLLVSSGNITSGGIFQPILIMMVEITAALMKNIFIPLILISTILSMVNNISEKVQISKLAAFLKQIGTVMLGFILTVFIAIITIQGSVGAVVDGVSSKTAKFAIGAFIPVAGKYLADAADTVLGCTLLIKNASGIAVMIGILSICIIPLIKIFALITLFKITCVLIEPVAEKRIVNCINDITGSLTFILGIVASVAFMFLIAVTVIITSSSIAAAIR